MNCILKEKVHLCRLKLFIIVFCVLLCSCAAVGSNPTESSMQIDGVTLGFQPPEGEYEVTETLKIENGFIVFYNETENQSSDDDLPIRLNPKIQVFSKKGTYIATHALDKSYDEYKNSVFIPSYSNLNVTGENIQYYLKNDFNSKFVSLNLKNGEREEYPYFMTAFDRTAVMLIQNEYDNLVGESYFNFTLIDNKGSIKTIKIRMYDETFNNAAYFNTYAVYTEATSPTHVISASLDADAATAVVTNQKLTYRLDFNTGSYTETRRYWEGLMEDEIAASPNGQRKLYKADGMGMGDGFWWDLVVKADYRYVYLDTVYNSTQALFMDDDTVAVNYINGIKFYDAATGVKLDKTLEFDYGKNETDNSCEYYTVSVACDGKNKRFLALSRDAQHKLADIPQPLKLVVFDYSGKLLKTLDTGYSGELFYKNHVWPYELAVNGDGTVTIIDKVLAYYNEMENKPLDSAVRAVVRYL